MKSILNLNLFHENDKVVLAVSGGIDSMVLLDAVAGIKDAYHLDITVAHVNHGVRPESIEEYAFVAEKCRTYGVGFEGMTLEHVRGENFHNYSRNKRYEFFYETARKRGAKQIVLAHHADDQAETILMRLVRGSGFVGYAGIGDHTWFRELEIIRPLLGATRNDIVAYQAEHGVDFRSDASNALDHYTRNRFRHHIMPEIEKEDPKYREKFHQFSTYLFEAYAVIGRLAEEYLVSSVTFDPQGAALETKSIVVLDRAVAREAIKKIIDRVTGNSLELSFVHLQSILRLVGSEKPNARITVDKTLSVFRKYDQLCFVTTVPPKPAVFRAFLGFGTYSLDNGDVVIISEKPSDIDGIFIELWYNNLDLTFPLTLRGRKPGDRIRLSGGTKKIADLLIDLKIPREERERIVVLENPQKEILWIPGIKIGLATREGQQKIYITYHKGP